MKVIVYILILLSIAGNLHADCDCLEPFYKDKIDLLTRYTACLEKCYNARIDSLETRLNSAESRISELEAEVDRIGVKMKTLQEALSNRHPK